MKDKVRFVAPDSCEPIHFRDEGYDLVIARSLDDPENPKIPGPTLEETFSALESGPPQATIDLLRRVGGPCAEAATEFEQRYPSKYN